MVSSSKILTVSYGTFSCTAEGFDDPLAVMKDTTHFFRSVVGEDRFFGAEPPQYDPELVADLMRQQVSTPEGGSIRLDAPQSGGPTSSAGAMAAALAAGPARAKTADPSPELPDDDTIEATAFEPETSPDAIEENQGAAATTSPEVFAGDLDAMLVQDAVAAAPSVEDAPAPRPADTASVASKLDRIRAVVAENEAPEADTYTAQPEAAPLSSDWNLPDIEDDTPVEDEPALIDDAGASSDDLAEHVAALTDTVTDTDTADVDTDTQASENLFTDTISALLADDVPEAEDAPDTADAPSANAILEAAFDEDGSDFDLVNALNEVDAAEDDMSGPATDGQTEMDTQEEIAAQVATVSSADASAATSDEPSDDVDPAQGSDIAEAPVEPQRPTNVRARVIKVKRSAVSSAIDTAETAATPVEAPQSQTAEQPVGLTPVSSDASSLSDDDEDELARELAAVKAELDREVAAWDSDEQADADKEEPVSTASDDEWGWDEEDEDDIVDPEPLKLDNPIADPYPVDTDLIGDLIKSNSSDEDSAEDADSEKGADTLTSAVAGVRKAVKLASPARLLLTENSVEDNDASRILDQTNSEMEEPEGNRRRSAIAHLRAAVAATKADRLLGRKSDDSEETEPYRADLANVVRPRRLNAGPARTQRPSSEPVHSAPLQLVAEQRVEADDSDTVTRVEAQTIRPRRVTRPVEPAAARSLRPQDDYAAEQADPMTTDGDFAAYASEVGARSLPDLLEAAAAYMSHVEGREQFSRPQLMTTVRQAEDIESSREDRLRSFGQLLRDGKIEKTSGGRFTASESNNFLPSRAAG